MPGSQCNLVRGQCIYILFYSKTGNFTPNFKPFKCFNQTLNQIRPFLKKIGIPFYLSYDTWHMTPDTWHLKHGTWNVTYDTWHVTHAGGWTYSKNFSIPSLTVWYRQCLEDFELKHDLMNDEGVYRTPPDTLGLSNNDLG